MKPLDAAKLAELRALHRVASDSSHLARAFSYHAHYHFLDLLECAERVAECEREIHQARNLAQEAMAMGVIKDKRIKELEEALTPSAATKAAYIGEFYFVRTFLDEDGEERTERIQVPWDTIKKIMAAIKARVALSRAGEV